MSQLELINQEINTEIAKVEVQKALLATTFKGLDLLNMRKALMEGMMRGFTFQDFLEKNVYAIAFTDWKTKEVGYSLITSVDYARKVGMRSGVVGKEAPIFEEKDGKIISCTVTVKKKTGDYIGDFTATVYFQEFTTGKNLWVTKPRAMLAKVAEMHALRMACPEELAQAYIEEEMERESKGVIALDDKYMAEVDAITNLKDLEAYYNANKGKGKDFDRYVIERKQALKNEKA